MKYKSYIVYCKDRYVETYNDPEKANAHVRWQEECMKTTGWKIVESEHHRTMTQESVANLIEYILDVLYDAYEGDTDSYLHFEETIDVFKHYYGNPSQELVDLISKKVNSLAFHIIKK